VGDDVMCIDGDSTEDRRSLLCMICDTFMCICQLHFRLLPSHNNDNSR